MEVFAPQTSANTKNQGFYLILPLTEPVVKHGTAQHWKEDPFLSRVEDETQEIKRGQHAKSRGKSIYTEGLMVQIPWGGRHVLPVPCIISE